MAETKTATTQSEVATIDAGDDSAQQRRWQRAFKFGFLACIAFAMLGWLSFLGWLVLSLFGF